MRVIRKLLPNFLKIRIYNLVNKIRFSKKHIKIHFSSKTNLRTYFEGYSKINKNVNIINSYIGKGTYIASNSNLSNCIIGKFCSIASNVNIISGRHPSKIFVSTHPAFFSLLKQAGFTFADKQLFEEFKYVDKNKKYLVKIGNDVWIGRNVSIFEGVTIGDGAIVGAGAIVTKSIEPYTINIGIPAKKITYRFDNNEINFLLDFKWWERDLNWLKKNYMYFSNIKLFFDKFGR